MNEDNFNYTEEDMKWFTVLYILLFQENEMNKNWNEFKSELTYQNRFTSSHPIVEMIHKVATDATYILKKDTILYRARIFSHNQYHNIISLYCDILGKTESEAKEFLSSIDALEDSYLFLSFKEGEQISTEKLKKAYEQWKDKPYKGFDAKNSGIPPAELVEAGRANPDHIGYLYLSEDENTPIYEVRPTIGQMISIASFRVQKNLRIYDFTKNIPIKTDNCSEDLSLLFPFLSKKFSKPYNGKKEEYLPTQYLTETIKNMGFDGIRFKSALNSNGINIVLFSEEYCKPFSSDLVEVKGMSLDTKKPEVYSAFACNEKEYETV